MSQRTTFRSVLLDILAGLVVLCLLIVFVVVYRRNDLQLFSLVTAILFFLAGALRGASAPQNSWLKAVLLDLGGAVPVIAMRATGMAFTVQGYVPMFIVFSLLFAVAGVETRHLLSRRRLWAASLVTLLSFSASALAVATARAERRARPRQERKTGCACGRSRERRGQGGWRRRWDCSGFTREASGAAAEGCGAG